MSLSSIRALLIDLSGTIHVENEVIPGAVEAVKKLRDANVPLKFVTNTTKVSLTLEPISKFTPSMVNKRHSITDS